MINAVDDAPGDHQHDARRGDLEGSVPDHHLDATHSSQDLTIAALKGIP